LAFGCASALLTLLKCIVEAGRTPSREGFPSSSENERKIPITRKIIIREKISFLKSSSKKFPFYSQLLPTKRAACSEYLQEAKSQRLLQPGLCAPPAEECLMQAMEEEEDGDGKGWAECISSSSSSLHFSACHICGLEVQAKHWDFGMLDAWLEKREQHTARYSVPHTMSSSRKENPR